jgi:hypothetical protein
VVADLVDLIKLPAVAVAGVYRGCEALPVVGESLRRGRIGLAEQLRAVVSVVVSQVVELVLDEIDMTELVRDRVDIDAIVAEVDIDAIVKRMDLIGLANTVIDGVDLPAIIRQSTNSVTAEVMTDVRTQGERADDVVSGIVDRMLGRNQARR